jgi:hypothetical protein
MLKQGEIAPMSEEAPWQTKSQMMVTLGKSSRTIDLWVRAGKIERMMDGSRAFFRVVTPGNTATLITSPTPPPELLAMLTEMRDELRALRAEVAALRALPPAQLPSVTPGDAVTQDATSPGNEAQPGKQMVTRHWWQRLLYGPEM